MGAVMGGVIGAAMGGGGCGTDGGVTDADGARTVPQF